MAKRLGKKLVEVRAHSVNGYGLSAEMDSKYSGVERLRYLHYIEYLLGSNSDTILLIDECESIFTGIDSHYTKERLHRFIESCHVPCIWITNYIDQLKPSCIRRFKLVCEVPRPPKSHLLEIVAQNGRGLKLSNDFKKSLIQTENLTPAIIANACHVAKMIDANYVDAENTILEVAKTTLEASGLLDQTPRYQGEIPFNQAWLNFKQDADVLALVNNAVIDDSPIRVLLLGPPGTGKTAYVHDLADRLDKPLIRVNVSDVLSKWVGESEQNIARLFQRSNEENAILLFDEVDSLLASRTYMQAHYEIQLVNELLAQMECNTQPLFAATNFADKLDKAVLRRFDVKLECGYLTAEQACTLYKSVLKIKRLNTSEQRSISQLQHLTSGDFAILSRRKRFNPTQAIRHSAIDLLAKENRRKQPVKSIGFIANQP